MEVFDFKQFQFVFVQGLSDELEDALINEYKIQELEIEDIFTNTQLSKIEQRSDYLYTAFQFPEFDKNKGQFIIKEVHCLISNEFFLLIDKHHHKHAIQFNNLKSNLFDTGISSYDLFYEMLDFFVTKDFRAISRFKSEINELEQDIFTFDIQNDLVQDILILKRNLSSFYSVVLPLSIVVTELQTKYATKLNRQDVEKLDDTLDKLKKMINNLDTMIKHANLLSESNNALIARSTNEVIRILTSISIIAIVPTMLFSFFGMNVFFGWSDSQNFVPLLGVVMLSLSLTFGVYLYFKKRDWI
jgi:magnesium transporter